MEKENNLEDLLSKILPGPGRERVLLEAAVKGMPLTSDLYKEIINLIQEDYDSVTGPYSEEYRLFDLRNIATIAENFGDLKKALTFWGKVADADPGFRQNVARIHEKLGDNITAREMKEKQLDYYFESKDLLLYEKAITLAEELGKNKEVGELKAAYYDRLCQEMNSPNYHNRFVIHPPWATIRKLGQELNDDEVHQKIFKLKLNLLELNQYHDKEFYNQVMSLAKEHEEIKVVEQYKQEAFEYIFSRPDSTDEQNLAFDLCETQEERDKFLQHLSEEHLQAAGDMALRWGLLERSQEYYREAMYMDEAEGHYACAQKLAEKIGDAERASIYKSVSEILK